MATLRDLLPAPTDGLAEPAHPPDESTPTPVVVRSATGPATKAATGHALVLRNVSDNGSQDAGGPDYSAVVRQGENASRTVHTNYDAMVEKPREEALRPMPTAAEIAEATRRTKAQLETSLSAKLSASSTARPSKTATYVRYTPADASSNAGASQGRIIKMVQAPRDLMEPPRFTQRKAPVNPPSPPVPVMHSPERKLSKAEAAEWDIPPVVSDWKNNRGYTISLDKRLAADGRQFINREINDRFAQMAEALYQASETAREEVEHRADLQRQVSMRAKAARERDLRQLAEKARQERKGYLGLSDRTDAESMATGVASELHRAGGVERAVADEAPPQLHEVGIKAPGLTPASAGTRRRRRPSRFSDRQPEGQSAITEEAAAQHRDEIRRERRLQREKEMRKRELHGDDSGRATLKRSKLTRDVHRDLSERVALGQSVDAPPAGTGEVLYDERLFNQDGGSTFGGGFGADDSYNLYDEALLKGTNASTRMLRGQPTYPVPEVAANDVAGEAAGAGVRRERQSAVEFERDEDVPSSALGDGDGDVKGVSDPYGLTKFLDDVSRK